MELKFEYTLGNHYKWGFGDEWHNFPNPTKQYKIHLGHVTRPVMSFREECVNAAKLIAEKATKPILIGLSGGGDSQMACISFREAGVPFKVIIVSLYDVNWTIINEEDTSTAYEFCKKFDIEYVEQHINLDYFYKGDGATYAEKYGITNNHTIVQLGVMDYVCDEYCYIMAGGDLIYTPYRSFVTPDRPQKLIKNSLTKDLTVANWWNGPQPILQHMMEMGYEGTSKFYMYTPELMYAYIDHPVSINFLDSQDAIYATFTRWLQKPNQWWKCYQYLYKPMMVKDQFPEVIPNRKLTGFEKLEIQTSWEDTRTPMMEYIVLLRKMAKGKCDGQVVVIPITELRDYLATPRDEEDVLMATRTSYIPV
jgi:hypothetical protein